MDELCGGALQLLSPLWDPPPTQETFWHFPFRGAHPLFLCLLTWMSLLMYKKSHRPSSLNVCHFACIIINDASCQEIIRIAVIISANCKSKFVTGHVGQPVRPPPAEFVVTEPALKGHLGTYPAVVQATKTGYFHGRPLGPFRLSLWQPNQVF